MTSIAEKRGGSYMHVPQQTRPENCTYVLRAKPPGMRARPPMAHILVQAARRGAKEGREKKNNNNARRKYYWPTAPTTKGTIGACAL